MMVSSPQTKREGCAPSVSNMMTVEWLDDTHLLSWILTEACYDDKKAFCTTCFYVMPLETVLDWLHSFLNRRGAEEYHAR